jgi:hypothetical protein
LIAWQEYAALPEASQLRDHVSSDWSRDDSGAADYLRTWIDRRLVELSARDYDRVYLQLERHPWRVNLFDLGLVPAQVTELIQIDFQEARRALRERPVDVLGASEALARALSRVTSASHLLIDK